MIGDLPPLQWLATFRAVMEAGSFAGAARLLHITPSAVSHQMRALETALGRPLFVRSKRTVFPTEEALDYAAAIAESFSRLITATNRIATATGVRRLAIHASPSFATLWLMPRLAEFLKLHPSLDVSLFASHEPTRFGEDGIMIDIQYGRAVPEACESLVLAEELVLPLASPAFVAQHGLTQPQDIARVPLIHSMRCLVRWDQWAARHTPLTVPHARGLQFDRSHHALSAAAYGLGLVLESNLHAGDMIRRGDLVAPFGLLGLPLVAHRLLYLREEAANPDIRAFVDWISNSLTADRALRHLPQNEPADEP